MLDVLGTGELFRRVADAADAGNEDHPYGSDSSDLLSVVARATGHGPGCESQFPGGVADQLLQVGGSQRRLDNDRLGEAERGAVHLADLFRIGTKLIEHGRKL